MQLAFLAAAVLEDSHLRKMAGDRQAEAARQPSLACLLDEEQIAAEGAQKLPFPILLPFVLSAAMQCWFLNTSLCTILLKLSTVVINKT